MTTTRTYDSLALDLLLAGARPGDRRFRALLDHAADRVPCPECGNVEGHEDNGQTGANRSLLCVECGYSFDPPGVDL